LEGPYRVEKGGLVSQGVLMRKREKLMFFRSFAIGFPDYLGGSGEEFQGVGTQRGDWKNEGGF